jgi:hypothetical protein
MELYNVRNMPGKALKGGTLVKKLCREWKKVIFVFSVTIST